MSPVLEEDWHLSYPFIMAHAGSVWMIPESSGSREVSIYRAENFPSGWKKEATLLENISAHDVTICWHKDCFWMFATVTHDGNDSSKLELFFSDDLLGPWAPHPANPILVAAFGARSGGNIVWRNGRLWRPVQDCRSRYGAALGLAEITRLDHKGYEQIIRKVLAPCPAWPGRKLHTLNQAGNLECIDGSAESFRIRAGAVTPKMALFRSV